MTLTLWLLTLCAPPIAVVLASLSGLHIERLRAVAVGCAGALFLLSLGVLFVPELHRAVVPMPGDLGELAGESVLRIDAFTTVLLPLAPALWLLTVAVTPRTRLDLLGLRRTAVATLVTMAAFLTESPALLAVLWTVSTVVYLSALTSPATRRAFRVAGTYLGASVVLFVAGVALTTLSPRGSGVESAGMWLLIAAALIRKGIFPFHAWLPEAFDRGRLGPTVLFSAPQVGAYATAVLIVPRATPEMLRVVAILALMTAVHGAALALFQRDARRACGYLFVSQSALVMAGLDCTSRLALTGALVLWVSSALAFTGIARCVLVLEVRRGRLDLSKHHGGYERMRLLATSFLVLGLACTGFPGTLGFIGQEMLVDGAVTAFPVLGFFVIVAGALTGLAVLRMYFSLFCGRRDDAVHLGLLGREAVSFASIAIFLVGAGIAPGPAVSAGLTASEHLLRARDERQLGPGRGSLARTGASEAPRVSRPAETATPERARHRPHGD